MSVSPHSSPSEVATLACGCFWCTEAIFKRLQGVVSVVSGYTGGEMINPSYEQVSTGATGHAEAVQITFDPSRISFEVLLDVFFTTHDPTTRNQQGADIGTQYRSTIFYHSEEQKEQAHTKIRQLQKASIFKNPIVTEVVPFQAFYKAEEHHQNYYDNNPYYPYCSVVISPKLQKLRASFQHYLKEEEGPTSSSS